MSCRFRELRRPDTPRKPKDKDKTPISNPKGKSPGIVNTVKTPVPIPGEDFVSFERHTRALQMEYKKSKRNTIVIGMFQVLNCEIEMTV